MVHETTGDSSERVAKRHGGGVRGKKISKKNKVEGISDAAIRRLALRSHSALQFSSKVYDEIRKLVEPQISETLRQSILVASSDRRATICTQDIELAMRGQNRTVYGLRR